MCSVVSIEIKSVEEQQEREEMEEAKQEKGKNSNFKRNVAIGGIVVCIVLTFAVLGVIYGMNDNGEDKKKSKSQYPSMFKYFGDNLNAGIINGNQYQNKMNQYDYQPFI